MTAPTYPKSLPGPHRFGLVPVARAAFGDMGGTGRLRTSDPGAVADCSFRFLRGEYSEFVRWWREDLLRGSRWFRIAVPSAGGVTWHVCRFAGEPRASNDGRRYWTVRARLEIRERQFALVAVDPFGAQVISLMHFEDADGTAVPKDEIGRVVWGNPGPQRQFTRDGVLVKANTDSGEGLSGAYALTAPFTVEFQLRVDAVNNPFWWTGQYAFVCVLCNVRLEYWSDGSMILRDDYGNASVASMSAISGALNHVAVTGSAVTNGNVRLRLFVRGAPPTSEAVVSPINLNADRPMSLGASQPWGGSWWAGCHDEWRVTEAIRYTDAFDPPTEPFPDPLA